MSCHAINPAGKGIAAILPKIDSLTAWAGDVKEYALGKALTGTVYPGFKVVEGRSIRKYTDEAAVVKAVEAAGADPYEKKLLGIDGKDVTFRASASIPRIYRHRFHRDIYKDLAKLQKSMDAEDPEASGLDSFSLEMFEDIAFVMAKHADPKGVPDTPDEWLEEFNTFSIYQVLPEIIDLWGLNVQTQVESKKNFERLTGK